MKTYLPVLRFGFSGRRRIFFHSAFSDEEESTEADIVHYKKRKVAERPKEKDVETFTETRVRGKEIKSGASTPGLFKI